MKGDKELVGTLLGFDDYVSILLTIFFLYLYFVKFSFTAERHGARGCNRIVRTTILWFLL